MICPVPPLAVGNAVPLYDKANVPVLVMGDPATVNILGADKATECTVPTLTAVVSILAPPVTAPSYKRSVPSLA